LFFRKPEVGRLFLNRCFIGSRIVPVRHDNESGGVRPGRRLDNQNLILKNRAFKPDH